MPVRPVTCCTWTRKLRAASRTRPVQKLPSALDALLQKGFPLHVASRLDLTATAVGQLLGRGDISAETAQAMNDVALLDALMEVRAARVTP